MKLQERLKVIINLLDSKTRHLAELHILQQTLINETIELRGKVSLLEEMIKEKKSEIKKEDEKEVKEEANTK